MCVCVQVCLTKPGGQPITQLLHTQEQTARKRESLVAPLLRDLLLPRGAEDLQPTQLSETEEAKSE